VTDGQDVEQPPEVLVVNKEVYLASFQALCVFLESASESYTNVSNAPIKDKETKKAILSIIASHIEAIQRIGEGFEASLQNPTEQDLTKIFLN
jgi:predicted patatin/cPLA2 family phospholipase